MYPPFQDVVSNLRRKPLLMEKMATTVQFSQSASLLSEQDMASSIEARIASMSNWLMGTASLFMETDALLRLIDELYVVTDRKAIREFVYSHPDLARILVDAYEPLVDAFGPFPRVQLSVVRDPEIQDRIEIFGAILTPLSTAEGLKRLERFDEIWFLRQVRQVKGLLIFDLEFV